MLTYNNFAPAQSDYLHADCEVIIKTKFKLLVILH